MLTSGSSSGNCRHLQPGQRGRQSQLRGEDGRRPGLLGRQHLREGDAPTDTFSEGSTIGLALAITGLAALGKLVGCGVGGYGLGRRSTLIVGVGMVPRGEIGFVVASFALSRGAIGANVFSSVVFMSVATTLLVPPVLGILYGRSGALEKDGGRC